LAVWLSGNNIANISTVNTQYEVCVSTEVGGHFAPFAGIPYWYLNQPPSPTRPVNSSVGWCSEYCGHVHHKRRTSELCSHTEPCYMSVGILIRSVKDIRVNWHSHLVDLLHASLTRFRRHWFKQHSETCCHAWEFVVNVVSFFVVVCCCHILLFDCRSSRPRFWGLRQQ